MPAHPLPPRGASLSRRDLLLNAGSGFAGLALTHLLDRDGLLRATPFSESKSTSRGSSDFADRQPHFPARAKSVIFLFMAARGIRPLFDEE